MNVLDETTLPMKIQVRLFARARDLAGANHVDVELPPGSTVADLRSALTEQEPRLASLAPALLVAVDNHYAADSAPLHAGAEVACFPPVSGG